MAVHIHTLFSGKRIVFGIPELKPIQGAVPGRQRLKLRSRTPAYLFVQTADGIRKFHLEDCGSHWSPCVECGRNVRISN